MVHPFVDSHVHTLDMTDPYPDYHDATAVFSCCSSRSDWSRMTGQRGRVVRFYGIHPWHCDQWCPDAEAELRSILTEDAEAGIGEIGLDGTKGDMGCQIPVFKAQLSMSKELGRPVQIHMARCEKEVLDCVRDVRPGVPLILHSFRSESYVKPFAELGCYFSLNPRILSMSAERVRRLVEKIPDDRLLFETDAPYVPKDFDGMNGFLSKVASMVGTDTKELALRTAVNAKRFIQWEE